MITIEGVYTTAKIFTTKNEQTNMDQYALAQLQALCDNPVNEGCVIRVMPDVHPGKVGTIGLTQTIGNAILPHVVGIDVGCGVSIVQIKGKKMEFPKLDKVIRECIPSGFRVRDKAHHLADTFDFSRLCCREHIRRDKALVSLGTLGSGNHFIELDKDEEGNIYLAVHSGSRHLGKEVTEYYLKEGRRELSAQGIQIPYELTYLKGQLMEQYLHDILLIQDFASLNRECIIDELCKGMKWKKIEAWECIHNYVELSDSPHNEPAILRKGAISAKKGENVIIPINMRDGILLGRGLGNKEWNDSAPHGAGRILKREDVKSNYTVSAFKAAMRGIYSSSIGKDTLDEAPFAYRRIEEIREVIGETVEIHSVLRPIYNFKAGSN